MVCNRTKSFPCNSLSYVCDGGIPTSSDEDMRKNSEDSTERRKNADRCLFGKLHLQNAMVLLVTVGTAVLVALTVVLFFKFRKAIFVLSIPAGITVCTVAAILTRRSRLVWPIIAVACFHAVLGSYALLIFSFYFVFKPYYIIMVLNWAFNTLYLDKTPSYYLHCSAVYLFLFVFLGYNLWQAAVAYRFKCLLARRRALAQPTVLVVNKPPVF